MPQECHLDIRTAKRNDRKREKKHARKTPRVIDRSQKHALLVIWLSIAQRISLKMTKPEFPPGGQPSSFFVPISALESLSRQESTWVPGMRLCEVSWSAENNYVSAKNWAAPTEKSGAFGAGFFRSSARARRGMYSLSLITVSDFSFVLFFSLVRSDGFACVSLGDMRIQMRDCRGERAWALAARMYVGATFSHSL